MRSDGSGGQRRARQRMSCSDLPSCSGLPSSAVSVGTTFMFGGLDDSVDPRPINELFEIAKNAFIGGTAVVLVGGGKLAGKPAGKPISFYTGTFRPNDV